MTAHDCFELGRQSYMNHDYYHTVLWMQEALGRLDRDVNRTLTKADILDYLSYSTFKEGNTFKALQMTNELLEIVPDHERARGNKAFYERELRKIEKNKELRGDSGEDDVPAAKFEVTVSFTTIGCICFYYHHYNYYFWFQLGSGNTKVNPTVYDSSERKLYEMGCRGELKQTPSELAKLKCKYVTNTSPFLKIAPLKLEEANLKPYIVVYHDVMYDSEMEVIKRLAKPRVSIDNSTTGQFLTIQTFFSSVEQPFKITKRAN